MYYGLVYLYVAIRFTVAASTADAVTQKKQKKINGRGIILVVSNEETNDVIKIVESLEASGILIKGINKTVEN